eukprot:2334541-Prymnesium_polylepis.1
MHAIRCGRAFDCVQCGELGAWAPVHTSAAPMAFARSCDTLLSVRSARRHGARAEEARAGCGQVRERVAAAAA